MSNENANQPAFPINVYEGVINNSGLTKREYFAAMAMPVVLKYCLENELSKIFETAAKDAIQMADEVLKQLNQ